MDLKHPAHKYANDVIKGKIPACRWVKLACERHQRDLNNKKWEWYYDQQQAERAFKFFETCLVLDGKDGQEPFTLFDWQYFVLGSIYGWRSKKDPDIRRFKECYIETARGAGKSPFAAGIATYHTFATGAHGAQSFCIARTAEQANATFRHCGRYAENLNSIRTADNKFRIFQQSSAPYIVAFPKKAQILKKLTSEVGGAGKSGYVAHCVIADEIMEMKSSSMLDKLKSAMKKNNPTPLLFCISNAGTAQEGVCWELHTRSKKLLDIEDKYKHDREFALIYTIDTNDDPYKNEKCWHKANPSLRFGVPSMEFYRDHVIQVKGSPSLKAECDRAFFSVWTSGASPWISVSDFEKITTKNKDNIFPPEDKLKTMRCYVGIDLSKNVDLTSITCSWQNPEDGKLYVRNHSWIPADNDIDRKERMDKSPYRAWEDEGYVSIVNDGVIMYEDIVEHLKTINETYKISMITLDSYRLNDFINTANRMGLPLYKKGIDEANGIPAVFCAQGRIKPNKESPGLYMPRNLEIFESKMKDGSIVIDYNPCLTKAAVSSMLISDNQGLRCFNKEKSYSRIDPIVSCVESIALADKHGKYLSNSEVMSIMLDKL